MSKSALSLIGTWFCNNLGISRDGSSHALFIALIDIHDSEKTAFGLLGSRHPLLPYLTEKKLKLWLFGRRAIDSLLISPH